MKLKLLFIVVLTLSYLAPTLQGAPHRGTLTVYAIEERSGFVYSAYTNFTEAWTATAGNVTGDLDSYDTASFGTNEYSGTYYVTRHFYTFDTSELKKNYRAENASLDFFNTGVGHATTWTVKLQKWTDTDDSLTTADFSAFDGINYDDGSLQREEITPVSWNSVPINDDNLLTKKGETKIVLRLSTEIEGYESIEDVSCEVKGGNSGETDPVRLTINYVWATGRVRPRGINPLFFVIIGVIIFGGISVFFLKKGKARRLYS